MSSGFITETEVADIRKRKQEEWEKVRKADDPMERPEESYDCRSLFERLQEQKQKRELEYEEAHKLKNMIKGLDDDEIEFLDLVDRTKLEADRKKELEEEIELKDYRNRVAILQEKSIEERLQSEKVINKPKTSVSHKNSQQKLLKGIVIKKNENQKRKLSEREEANGFSEESSAKQIKGNITSDAASEINGKSVATINSHDAGLKCVAILPGLGNYGDSSSDENSSDSEIESKPNKIDLLGRKIEIQVKENTTT